MTIARCSPTPSGTVTTEGCCLCLLHLTCLAVLSAGSLASPPAPSYRCRCLLGQRRRKRPLSPRPTRRSSSDRKSTRLNSSHVAISYAVFCLKKKQRKLYA